MKKHVIAFVLAMAVALAAGAAAGADKPKQGAGRLEASGRSGRGAALPDRFRKWLDEDAAYIITSMERDVFLKLTTDRERDLFIDAFWKARNPDPESVENSVKKEHYRRIEYANKWFGRGYSAGGWRSASALRARSESSGTWSSSS